MDATQLKELLAKTDKTPNAIEKEIKIPQGTLGKALNGKRSLPSKWDMPLKRYVAKNKSTDAITVQNEIVEDKIVVIEEVIVSPEILIPIEVVIPTQPLWVQDVEQFCNNNNCMPQDLMDSYKLPVKKPDTSLFDMLPKIKNESFFEKRQREALYGNK